MNDKQTTIALLAAIPEQLEAARERAAAAHKQWCAAREELLAATPRVDKLIDARDAIKLELRTTIAAATDAAGKKMYSNEDARKAALDDAMRQNNEYQLLDEQVAQLDALRDELQFVIDTSHISIKIARSEIAALCCAARVHEVMLGIA